MGAEPGPGQRIAFLVSNLEGGGVQRMLSILARAFVARGFAPFGVTVVVANYALCPAVSILEISRQMRSLVAWTAHNIADYNGDPDDITVCGHSAGGHLTAMCALTDWAAYGLPANCSGAE